MSGGWSSEFYQHTAYLMAAARRKGKSPSPTILFGLLPHSGEPLSGGRLRLPQPHGTCSSVQPAVGGARPGLGAASPLIPPPDPQDLSLRGWGGREGGSPREAAAGERPRPSCSREEAGRGRGSGGRSRGGIALPQRRCLWSLRSGCTGMEDCETMEDVYMASVETDRGVKEQLHLYDTRGLQEGVELPKHYFSFADGFVLVYSVNNLESFQRVELLKKEIDKFKDKKEVAIVVLGNKIDLSEQRQVDAEVAQQWARSEKVRLWEVTVTDRRTLIEPFTLLASKLSQPQSKSSFPLPGRKNKGNSSSEN
uniref:NFKB inhibitor interacting Ras like 1 n=2 Tax=Canis lupus familiaris TaxID=9615 RepID=A0A8C0PIF3_CANLF